MKKKAVYPAYISSQLFIVQYKESFDTYLTPVEAIVFIVDRSTVPLTKFYSFSLCICTNFHHVN